MTQTRARKNKKTTTRVKRIARVALAYDLGGTKVEAGLVRDDGKILRVMREPALKTQGPKGLVAQMTALGKGLLATEEGRKVRQVGLASAGPLDPSKGVLLDPTNMFTDGKSWGKVPLARLLSAGLNLPVILENDAAAAVLAENWKGAARRYKNVVVMTLGTGLGVGVICDGKLVRAGRGLHPEGGHIVVRAEDESYACACGNIGCAEAMLSGNNFAKRAREFLGVTDAQSASEVSARAHAGDGPALRAFEEYAKVMAAAMSTFVVLYSPEIIVLAGSFAAASDLFLPRTQEYLERAVARRRVGVDLLPKLAVSTLDNHSGLLGGAYVALH